MENRTKVLDGGIYVSVNLDHIERALYAMRGTVGDPIDGGKPLGGIDGVILAGGVVALIEAFDQKVVGGAEALFELIETGFGKDILKSLACASYGLVDLQLAPDSDITLGTALSSVVKRRLLEVEERYRDR
jgi:hypothetical protein